MRSIEEVLEQQDKFRRLQAKGYDRYEVGEKMGDYYRGWDDGVLMFVAWLLEERG